MTLTFTLDRVILQTFMHHSSTSTYTYQILLKSKKRFVEGRTYGLADGHLRPMLLNRLGGVDLINERCTGANETELIVQSAVTLNARRPTLLLPLLSRNL